MQSRNPVFGSAEQFQRGGYATFNNGANTHTERSMNPSAADLENAYNAPSATAIQTGRMTMDDVVMRSATLFGVMMLTAVPTFLLLPQASSSMFIVMGAGLVAMVLSFLAQRRGRPNVPVMMAFAAVEGVFIGGISAAYASYFGSGIIINAIAGTLCAFGAMLLVYKTGLVRNSPKFTKVLTTAAIGYLIFGLINMVGVLTHMWTSPYAGGGILAIGLSAFGVVLASFFLIMDFDFVEQGLRNGLPREFAWTAAFGLITTLAWMYVEILRLLSILRGND